MTADRRRHTISLAAVAVVAGVNPCVGFATSQHDGTSALLKRRLSVSALNAAATPSASTEEVLREGRLVEFTTGTGASKTTTLGAILGPDGKRNLKILSSSGRTSSVPPRSIQSVVPNGFSILTEEQIGEHERAAAEALEDDATGSGEAVLEVWEMLLEDDPSATIELTTLADLIVGDDSSQSCYATRKVLRDGIANFCFKEVVVKGNNSSPHYEPRPANIVEALKTKAAADAEEKAKWDELNDRISNTPGNFDLEKESEEVRTAFKALERLGCLANVSPDEMEREEKKDAIGSDKAESISVAKTFLMRLGHKSTPESARSLLTGAGIWDVHTNLDVIRLRIPTSFGSDLERLASDLELNPPADLDAESRRDLTHFPAFAIDEESTREIDDALSVEVLADAEKNGGPMHTRQRLWVHIADPSRYVELGSPLDKEARRRLSSHYLPTGTVPMFPLMEALMSLYRPSLHPLR
jgi:exoribonuclease-2